MSEMGMAMMGTGVATGENRARLAAEAAIASPLLEDISLVGAKGVLVNITAGEDLTMSEFEEVGDAIKGFTSDDATVIVGTVIDTRANTDELRVTLVATGLGKPIIVSPVIAPLSARVLEARHFDVRRPMTIGGGGTTMPLTKPVQKRMVDNTSEADMDYLDIPAFLRRQVD